MVGSAFLGKVSKIGSWCKASLACCIQLAQLKIVRF